MDRRLKEQVARVVLAKKIYSRKGGLILEPQDIIKKALSLSKIPAVAFSGGKASLAILRMVLDVRPDALVMFNNTGVEHPLTVKYVHEMRDRWGFQLLETQPVKTFWQCVDEYGFPQIRGGRDSRASATRRNTRTPACYRYLKELPAMLSYRDHHADLTFTGIQAGEARVRFQSACVRGQYFYSKRWGMSKCAPIIFWTDQELWNYINANNLPYNPLYGMGHKRIGCMPCTGFIGWQSKLAKTDPKLLKFILKKQGQTGLDDWLLGRFSRPPCDDGPTNEDELDDDSLDV